jgi:hypothetical protein
MRSPISGVFLGHMLAAQQLSENAAKLSGGAKHRTRSVSSSAPSSALSLLDESDLFDMIQRQGGASGERGGDGVAEGGSEQGTIDVEGAAIEDDVESNSSNSRSSM